MKANKMPRFSKGEMVDIRLPGARIGDWESGEVTEVKEYAAGPLYKVKTVSGKLLTVEEDDLFRADS